MTSHTENADFIAHLTAVQGVDEAERDLTEARESLAREKDAMVLLVDALEDGTITDYAPDAILADMRDQRRNIEAAEANLATAEAAFAAAEAAL